MYTTRIKWAELWFRALGYNEDYWYYCVDMRESGFSEEYSKHRDYEYIKEVYEFFGDVFSGANDGDLHTDMLTDGMLMNWQGSFDKWLAHNRNKLIPEKLDNISYLHDVILKKNQPTLQLFQVGNWDSENNQKSVEKLLDVFHMHYIEEKSPTHLLVKGLLSGKACWQQDYDKYLRDSVTARTKEYVTRVKELQKKLDKKSKQTKRLANGENVPSEELITDKQEGKYIESLNALQKKGLFKFDDVRGLWDAQFKDRQKLFYAIVNSAITGQFPSSFVDI